MYESERSKEFFPRHSNVPNKLCCSDELHYEHSHQEYDFFGPTKQDIAL